MRPKARIIQIAGIRGILLVIFITACLIAGFVGFPSLVAMYGWNILASKFEIPSINMLQGAMLWALIAGSIYLANDKKKYLSAFQVKYPYRMDDEEFRKIIEIAKIQSYSRMIKTTPLTFEQLQKELMKLDSKSQSNSTNPIENVKEVKVEKPEELENINK